MHLLRDSLAMTHFHLSLRALLRQLPFAGSGQAGHGSGEAQGRSNLLNQKIASSQWCAPRNDKWRED
jgi:hypothetical protein